MEPGTDTLVMTSVFNLSRYITLINIAVTGIIIWLALSFLHTADKQRQESNSVLLKIAIQQDLYRVSRSISRERTLFSVLPNGSSIDENSRITDSSIGLPELLNQMSSHQDRTRELMQETKKSLLRLSTDKVYLEHMLFDESVLVDSIRKYETLDTRLNTYRSYIRSQLELPPVDRDNSVNLLKTDTLNAINKQLIRVSQSINFNPTESGPTTANNLAFIKEAWETLENTMLMATSLGVIGSNQQTMSPTLLNDLAMLEYTLNQNWKNLIRRAKAKHIDLELTEKLGEVEKFYRQTFLYQGSRILSRPDNDSVHSPTSSEWITTTEHIESGLEDITNSLFSNVAAVARNSKSRAMRNLLIDSALVFGCLCISLCSLVISRRIRHQAYHDSLTGLANRSYLESHLSGLNTKIDSQSRFAVVFIDLDRFKSINDNYGHAIGDELLKIVATRLDEQCHSNDVLARLGGDEFAILLNGFKDRQEVEFFAEKCIQKIERDIVIHDICLSVGGSAGISFAPEDCKAGPDLLKNADIAMYHGKADKVQNVYCFNNSMAEKYRTRLKTEQQLRHGLEQQQFELHYQPKICTQTGKAESVEALLRWRHPERGFVSPAEFVPIAEETGLMVGIGSWVLDRACEDTVWLGSQGLSGIKIAVNISAQQFSDEHFFSTAIATLHKHGLAHSRLELEVTESLLMNDLERVVSVLQNLKDTGISIAIDDFGTGYSSLQYLQTLPLNVLKIDRAFVKTLDSQQSQNSVANSIVQLAHSLGLETVAEGVETPEQDQNVRALGVNHIQGFLYSKPVPREALVQVVQDLELRCSDQLGAKAA